MFTPGSHSLTGREYFSACTPTNFRCGRFVLMSRENSRSSSSRPSSLTYTPLGVFSSPEEKIIQGVTRENKRRNPVLGVTPQLSHRAVGRFCLYVLMFFFSRSYVVRLLFLHARCIQGSGFNTCVIKITIAIRKSNFSEFC